MATYPSARLFLWCFEQNDPSCRFYERRGGVAVERNIDDAPCEGALDHPPSREQDEAALGPRPFHDLQGDAVISCRFRRTLAGHREDRAAAPRCRADPRGEDPAPPA